MITLKYFSRTLQKEALYLVRDLHIL